MDGIILNIISYFIFSMAMVAVVIKYEKDFHDPQKNRSLGWVKISSAILLMCWCFFMTMYLVVDYDVIMESPLNVRLNFFEAITNGLLPIYIVASNFPEVLIRFFKK
jgi:hypothetical protein